MDLTLWFVYAAFGVTAFIAVFLWAVRNQQFRHQEEARFLALEAETGPSAEGRPAPRLGLYWIWAVLAAAVVMFTLVVLLAYHVVGGR